MTTKYGIRYYTEVGAYLAFKDTTFFGITTKREWLTRDGSILREKDVLGKAMCLSREEATGSVKNYFDKQRLLDRYVDEYVYKEEWWENDTN